MKNIILLIHTYCVFIRLSLPANKKKFDVDQKGPLWTINRFDRFLEGQRYCATLCGPNWATLQSMWPMWPNLGHILTIWPLAPLPFVEDSRDLDF